MSAPTFTVLLLCWNHADFLETCIGSLMEQSDEDFEIVFLDNCSTDGSFEKAERLFAASGKAVTMIRNEQPENVPENCQRLLKRANSDLVSLLSTDDWYQPTYIEQMKKASLAHPEAVWLYPSITHFLEETKQHVRKPDFNYRSGDISSETRKLEWNVGFLGICYRTDALRAIGGWDPNMIMEDTDLIYRLSQVGQCVHVPEYLVNYRISANAMTKNLVLMSSAWELFFNKYKADFPDRNRKLASYNKTYTLMALKRGKFSAFLRLLSRTAKFGLRSLAFDRGR